ncbi:hypothetical protein [Bryobacter aggregatus]|uniref:hypothetical protein n=1 Tax=Bryobacter aggregatus TaxID=360054 RepID=UPI0004E1B781|nr:hypothetical protein [Bryobacter aggregatus]
MALVYDPAKHDVEIVHAQFNRLIAELIKGAINRNTFQPWEIEVLLDIQSCDIGDLSQKDLLKRYQRAVQRSYEKGCKMPLKLSEYLSSLKARRDALSASSPNGAGVENQIAS